MIRVLHVVTYMGRGGLETMLMNYYRNIDRNLVQFDFLVHRDFEADYDEEILSLGGRIYRISRLIPWSSSYRKNLKAIFREHPEYTIIHVHQDCLSAVALQCALEAGIPVRIAHCHNSSQDKNWKYLIKLHYMKQIPKYATDLLACSNTAGKWMFGGADFCVLNNAIELNKYVFNPGTRTEIRKKLNFESGDFVIGNVGGFRPQKNHTFLIDVFAQCIKRSPNAKLLLVGDGEERKQTEDKVKMLGLQERVVFTGVRSDIPELLQAMDVFVFPSIYEGLGISVIEAQASGLPCIISNSIPEDCIVTNNLIERLPLTDSAEIWADRIILNRNAVRSDHIDEVRAAGYDIQEKAKELEQFYVGQ